MTSVFTEPFTVGIEERDGKPRLVSYGREGWVEPICPVCDQPIQWVLDMYSMVRTPHAEFVLAHARCAWSKNGFRVQEALAQE